jgi:hypothetical protein
MKLWVWMWPLVSLGNAFLMRRTWKKLTVKNNLKNNDQNFFWKITVKKYLKITAKKYLKKRQKNVKITVKINLKIFKKYLKITVKQIQLDRISIESLKKCTKKLKIVMAIEKQNYVPYSYSHTCKRERTRVQCS